MDRRLLISDLNNYIIIHSMEIPSYFMDIPNSSEWIPNWWHVDHFHFFPIIYSAVMSICIHAFLHPWMCKLLSFTFLNPHPCPSMNPFEKIIQRCSLDSPAELQMQRIIQAFLLTNLIILFLKGCQITWCELFCIDPAACFQWSIVLSCCRTLKMAFTVSSRRLSETLFSHLLGHPASPRYPYSEHLSLGSSSYFCFRYSVSLIWDFLTTSTGTRVFGWVLG